MNKEQLLELINSKIAGQGSAVDIGGALAPVLIGLVTNLEEVAENGGITVALDCPILNPYSEELYYTFDVAGLSEQLNFLFNKAENIELRKYFSHLNAEVEYVAESSIDIHLGYTWDDGSYFGARNSISIEIEPEDSSYTVVVGEWVMDEQTDRYIDDWETIICQKLSYILFYLSPTKVLKIGKAVVA